MIKLLGVMMRGGTPVKIKFFGETQQERAIPSLISAVKGIAETIGHKEVKKLEFDKEKLLLTGSRKGYTLIALTDVAEAYIHRLIQIIAEDIDAQEEIPPSQFCVKEHVKTAVEDIIKTYVRNSAPFNLANTIEEIWEPLLREAQNNEGLSKKLRELDERLEQSEAPSKRWAHFEKEIATDSEQALQYALGGHFNRACAASLRLNDPLMKLFSVRMGLLALDTIGMTAPPLSRLEQVLDTYPEETPFTRLLNINVKAKRKEILPSEYFTTITEAIETFEFGDDEQDFIRAFLFLGESYGYFQNFAKKLSDFFKNKSQCLATYIDSSVERSKMVEKANSITELGEIQTELNEWGLKIENITETLDEKLRSGFLGGLFGLKSDQPADIHLSLKYLCELRAYMQVLMTLTGSPVLTLEERRDKLRETITYFEYFKKALDKDVPIRHTTLLDAFSMYSTALLALYRVAKENERDRLVMKARTLLPLILDVAVEEIDKIRPIIRMLIRVTSSATELLARAGEKYDAEFLLLYLLVEHMDIKRLENWKQAYPPNFIAISINLLFSFAAIAEKFLTGKAKNKTLKKCITRLAELMKWLLYQGKVSRGSLSGLCYYASKVVGQYSKSELKTLTRTLIGFSKIAVLDWEKKDYYLAEISDSLLGFLINMDRRLGNGDISNVIEQVYERSLNAWRKYGFDKRADQLKKMYDRKESPR